MKISLFTGRHKDPRREEQVREAAEVATEHGAQLLVLPGYSLGLGRDDCAAVQALTDAAGEVWILAEACDEMWTKACDGMPKPCGTFCFRPGQQPLGPFVQCFATGADARHDRVRGVAEEFVEGKRLFEVGGKTVGVLLCGENNFLTNIRKNSNELQPRHPDVGWPFVYDVLVNPAHTSMGQWNLLHERFAYFSRYGRTLLYCTNNTHRSWRTALCIYRDGKKVMMGDFTEADGLRAKKAEGWRLITIEIPVES